MSSILAEKLGKALESKGLSVPAGVDNTLSGQFNGDEMPMDARIGDVFLIKLDSKAALNVRQLKSVIRPIMIWGIYRDQKNKIKAVDVINMTTKSTFEKFLYPDALIYDENDLHLVGSNKPGRIGLADVSTLPWISLSKKGSFLNHAGCINKADLSIFPHMVIRRHESITRNPGNLYSREVCINPEWIREGLFLPASTPVLSGGTPPEIDSRCQRLDKPFQGLDQEMISRLIHWSENFYKMVHARGGFLIFPGLKYPCEQWPDWEEFSDPGFVWTPPEEPLAP